MARASRARGLHFKSTDPLGLRGRVVFLAAGPMYFAPGARFLIPLALLLTTQQAPKDAAVEARPPALDHAVLISVDGLRSDALLAVSKTELPGFARLTAGASTLNARTDPDFTVTLPNHTGMVTGRLTLGGEGHGWIENVDPPKGATLHRGKGAYVTSIFDVAHDRGIRTALFAGKTKFSLYDVSWDEEHGAADATGGDEGRDKIDEYVYAEKLSEIADGAIRFLGTGERRCFVLAHFALTDHVGHAAGWDVTPGSQYMRAVAAVDREIGRLLDAIEGQEGLRRKTAVVLTADHGGGAPFRSHEQPWMWVDYIIPFLVWTGDAGAGGASDLYVLNAGTRADPGLSQAPSAAGTREDGADTGRADGTGGAREDSRENGRRDGAGGIREAGSGGQRKSTTGNSRGEVAAERLPPIRNSDAANLIGGLLGLPSVPGSTVNAKQDLVVVPKR